MKQTFLMCLLTITSTLIMAQKNLYKSENLVIEKTTPNLYLQITYLNTDDYGKVACNGAIYISNNEAVIFDTPSDSISSIELINYVKNELKSSIKAVVINHFHIDCLGGLKEFHAENIPSYASNKTIVLAKEDNQEVPQNGFDKADTLTIGNQKIINTFFGEAHSKGNIISYIPSEKALFGGCQVKALGAGKGNLNSANIHEWPNSIENIKKAYSEIQFVVPGHGKIGGAELLDFTIQMFEEDRSN
ncbi:subclass B1 metallo-beta-lactamase [Fulvivirga lutimaris]|uniref:subclass B1 metallo-beta-lactamase n=1 Tax=Fulvivirga lutimaris TaxID=1819566 RepID=UPI0012BD5483|nr:subclass B1 metallo-beta-lactamase [Fulvivirga lutimaris]MTI41079.1 subclass B1 metallo-beta-lactamase [Fulvivirga lutimaris]